ncbi:MAG: RNA methyltransferase, partial [Lactobacillus sp.]|nr:RNA methyltransferase [Lactobacillus sp.]
MLKLPVEFKEKYQKLLGDEEATEFFAAMNEESKKAFRINTLKNPVK